MSKEHFTHTGSKKLLDILDDAARKSGTSRGNAFSDFLEITVCTLSGQQMEEQYMKVIQPYAKGEKGRRGIDRMAEAFAKLVELMDDTRADILGDVFMGGITYGEHGQFYTPEQLCELMAKMQLTAEDTGKRIFDPCCGSGRMLLAAANVNRDNEFYGQDIDLRCVRMTAINLALRNLYGYVIWGNSLAMEQKLAYRTGFNGKGFIRELAPAEIPEQPPVERQGTDEEPPQPAGEVRQLTLF